MKSKYVQLSIWISLFFHLLLVLLFTVSLSFQIVKPEKPEWYVPAYTSTASYTPPAASAPDANPIEKNLPKEKEGLKTAQSAIKKSNESQQQKQPTQNTQKVPTTEKAISKLASKKTDNVQKQHYKVPAKSEEPVHLVGDKKVDKPLVKILGRAITHHLIYPRVAYDFNLRGTAYVGFVLRPDGVVSQVRIVQSSNAGVLDAEAVRAVSAISPVRDVAPYIKEPTFLVVGIIFG